MFVRSEGGRGVWLDPPSHNLLPGGQYDWSIENSLHWQLDVTFGEDQSRIRKGHADANFSIVRRMALSLLKNEESKNPGVKSKRLAAGWNDDYLEQVLFGT
ncbi:hypothetical protein SAMN05444166_2462 [Singulisphaera sp. GP187]|nr:hypothetical protein SAMN05444166_2462 [Singulisphaera sp. GP187]